jgi:hypothetical protein
MRTNLSPERRRTLAGVVLIAAGLTVAACASPGHPLLGGGSQPAQSSPAAKRVHATLPRRPMSYLGVYEPDVPGSYTDIDGFAKVAGRQPNVVLYYNGWDEPFQSSFAQQARSHGATLMVDLDPTSVSVRAIATGRQDFYLRSYADAVRNFGAPVIISFGHEMNGNWYPWGWTHTPPQEFVRAWRHVVTVFRRAGADNVTWLWTVNGVVAGEGPISDYWPGAKYVTWVGIDGYYYQATATFYNTFVPTIEQIRQLTSKPIVIGETAIGQVAGQAAELPGLFAGARQYGLLGLVWFDQEQSGNVYKQDWRLEGDPVAEAAFRREVSQYIR